MAIHESIEIGTPADEAELRRYARYVEDAFTPNPTASAAIDWMQREGVENFRLVRLRGQVAGGLEIIPMGQWFGGRSVPMCGIAAAVIAPEHRSTGLAGRLLRSVLEEMRETGLPLSTLYPSTQPVYRRAGYEQAGVSVRYLLPATSLAPRDRVLDVRLIGEAEDALMRDLYAERARRTAGNLDRGPVIWGFVFEGDAVGKYVVERDGVPEGYVVYGYSRPPGERERKIVAHDLVALTPDAGRRLLSFLANHRSTVSNVEWVGSPAESLLFHVPNQDYKIHYYDHWMLRLVDVRAALEARGYPEVEAELHLDVRDDVLAWNDGKIVLTVSGGRAEVREGGEGRISVDVRGLASLYTGYLSPLEMRAAGYVDGPEADLARLGAVFAGPFPWMPDHF